MNDSEIVFYNSMRLIKGKGFYDKIFCALIENNDRKGYNGRQEVFFVYIFHDNRLVSAQNYTEFCADNERITLLDKFISNRNTMC